MNFRFESGNNFIAIDGQCGNMIGRICEYDQEYEVNMGRSFTESEKAEVDVLVKKHFGRNKPIIFID